MVMIMTEDKYRVWDLVLKIVGFISLIISALWGIYQYVDVRSRELSQFADQKEREFYSEFWNQRLKLYIQTLDAAARISKSDSDEDFRKAVKEFRTLFDGSMAVVQDSSVDRTMHEFAALVDKVEKKQMDRKDLGIRSYHLGRRCYESLRDSWNQPFSKQASTADGKGN
jgi:hypothetical protein